MFEQYTFSNAGELVINFKNDFNKLTSFEEKLNPNFVTIRDASNFISEIP